MAQLDLFLSHSFSEGFTEDIFRAYYECRKNKRNTINALQFEVNFEEKLFALIDDIRSGRYRPGRSVAFIVNKPVKREIFAAGFRDRVVHHYIIGKLNPYFEKLFIEDSYACRKGKGTHYGIRRMMEHIRQASENYQSEAFLKIQVNRCLCCKGRKFSALTIRSHVGADMPKAP